MPRLRSFPRRAPAPVRRPSGPPGRHRRGIWSEAGPSLHGRGTSGDRGAPYFSPLPTRCTATPRDMLRRCRISGAAQSRRLVRMSVRGVRSSCEAFAVNCATWRKVLSMRASISFRVSARSRNSSPVSGTVIRRVRLSTPTERAARVSSEIGAVVPRRRSSSPPEGRSTESSAPAPGGTVAGAAYDLKRHRGVPWRESDQNRAAP